jgi:N-acetylmuramoyl-L-alanine amidase
MHHPVPGLQKEKSISRRTVLKSGAALLLSVGAVSNSWAAKIMAVRVWPSDDYTRVTLENDSDLKATHFIVKDPLRLVVDIDGLELNPTLKDLVAKIEANDPYIKQVRVGQNRPGVVRLVFDLKTDVRPQVFTLKPVGGYQHRLVFDLYPAAPVDPIERMMLQSETSNASVVVTLPETPVGAATEAASTAPILSSPPTPLEKEIPKTTLRTPPKKRPVKVDRVVTIAIDPGHGGEDPGAIGKNGNKEKHVVLAIAKRLKSNLERDPNVRVMLTRDGDYFVPLHERVKKARKVKADLFVSVHADAWVEPTASGSSVFILSEKGASSTAAKWLAGKENASDLVGGANVRLLDRMLAGVLLDMSTTAQIKDSMKLAQEVLGALGGINRLHRGAVEQAGFAVLKAPDIPSILIETAFLSNPEEERKLTDDRYQDRMAEAVANGIRKYFSHNPALANTLG